MHHAPAYSVVQRMPIMHYCHRFVCIINQKWETDNETELLFYEYINILCHICIENIMMFENKEKECENRSGIGINMKDRTIRNLLSIALIISVSLNIYFVHNRTDSDYEIVNRIISFVRSINQSEDTGETAIPSDEELEEMKTEVIRLTNEYRVSLGLNELEQDDLLTKVAEIRAMEIVTTWGHNRPDGSTFADILAAMHYPSPRFGENLGKAQQTASEVVEMWKESPGHNANLTGDFTKIGVDIYVSEEGILYFAQIFAK